MLTGGQLRGTEAEAPRTLEEIGLLLGVTRERVRQIERRALEKLRRRFFLIEANPGRFEQLLREWGERP